MSLKPVDRWAGEAADFNRPVADVIYKTIMSLDPDEAQVFSELVLATTIQNELMVHGEEIGKALQVQAGERAELLKRQLARTAIAKGRRGMDATGELVALDSLSKSIGTLFGGGPTHAQRVQNAHEQLRDLQTGQFQQEHIAIDHSRSEPLPQSLAARAGVPHGAFNGMTAPQLAQFQNAYAQVAALVGPYQRLPAGQAFLHLIREHDANKNGTLVDIPAGKNGKLDASLFDPTHPMGPVTEAKVSRLPTPNAPGATFDVLRAFGVSPAAAATGAGQLSEGLLSPSSVGRFGAAWAPQANDEALSGDRRFRRLRAAADLLGSALGPTSSPQTQMAVSVAQHVGTFGPVAQKVIGPAADRAAYRYRGTERKPDQALLNAHESDARLAAKRSGAASTSNGVAEATQRRDRQLGMNQSMYDERFREAYTDWERAKTALDAGRIDRDQYKARASKNKAEMEAAKRRLGMADAKTHDRFKSEARDAKSAGSRDAALHASTTDDIVMTGYSGDDNKWRPSATLDYFKHRVPSPELNNLQLASGVTPPSEGVIFDSKGHLAHQAVGYGDDHYLPFNLKNLRRLRGGEYIRTRTLGGPTTEDIYTGLISGARRLTVVSNSGVFTVTFDPTFHGGRRYNDKAARMVGRYGHLLDAVKGGNITPNDIDQSMVDQFHELAAARFRGDPKGQADEVRRLEADFLKNPVLSTRQKQQAATDWLTGTAAPGLGTKGNEASPEQLAQTAAARLAADDVAAQREAGDPHASWVKIMAQRTEYLDKNPDAVDRVPPPPPEPARVVPESLEVAIQRRMAGLDDMDPVKRARNIARAIGQENSLTAHMNAAEQLNRDALRKLRLNGNGYASALNALHEQFPYYLLKPEYHPWADTADRQDTGYVKPRFNRPALALSGYFDPTLGGKVSGDSIRYQHGSTPNPIKSTESASAPTPPTPSAPSTPLAPAGLVRPPADAKAARVAVDQTVLDHVLAQKVFGDEFAQGGLRGKEIRGLGGDVNMPPPLKPFFAHDASGLPADPATIKAQFTANPDAWHQRIADVLAYAMTNKAFDVPADMAANFRAGGIAPPAALGDVPAMLAAPNVDYNIPDPAFRAGSGVGSEDIQIAYAKDPQILGLVVRDLLPQDADAPDFDTMSRALHTKLSTQHAALQSYRRLDGGLTGQPPVDEVQLRDDVMGLVAANQLHRRHAAAVEVEGAATEPEAEGNVLHQDVMQMAGDPTVIAGMTPQAAADYGRNMKIIMSNVGARLTPEESAVAQRWGLTAGDDPNVIDAEEVP